LGDTVEEAPGQRLLVGTGTGLGQRLELSIQGSQQALGCRIGGDAPGTQPFEQAARGPPQTCVRQLGGRLAQQFAHPEQDPDSVWILRIAQPGYQGLLVGRPHLGSQCLQRCRGRLLRRGWLYIERDVEEDVGRERRLAAEFTQFVELGQQRLGQILPTRLDVLQVGRQLQQAAHQRPENRLTTFDPIVAYGVEQAEHLLGIVHRALQLDQLQGADHLVQRFGTGGQLVLVAGILDEELE